MLSETSQSQKDEHCMIATYMSLYVSRQTHREQWLPRAGRRVKSGVVV